jgi:hypothetical protein
MNSKDKNFKKILKLERRQVEVWEAQRKLGYEKLEVPYQKGWEAHWVLRHDAARREDADKLQSLLNRVNKTIYSDNKEFKEWNRHDRVYQYQKPGLSYVPEREIQGWHNWAVKWFKHVPSEDKYNHWYGGHIRQFRYDIPSYYLVMKVEKRLVTHYRVVDEVLEQESAELSDKISELLSYRNWWRRSSKSAKSYQQTRNRSFRSKGKREIRKAIRNNNFEDMELPICKKQVSWDMW